MNRVYTDSELREARRRRNRIRRARQLRRRIIIAVAVFIVIVSSTIGISSIISKAQSTDETIKVKQYTSVMIPYSSSLYDMAEEYMDSDFYNSYEDYINEVKFINHLNNDDIKAGEYLILPYYVEI